MPRRFDFIVVANRLPVRRVSEDGRKVWRTSPGGLVSALMPILRQERESGREGAWIGWSGARKGSFRPFEHEGVYNVPITLSREQLLGYYEGMANSTLWPLYHDVVRPPVYRRSWWRIYEQVNALFAERAARLAAAGALVWFHDYHLHLTPGMLRERRPDLRVGFFLHIPFPGRGLFAQLPWRRQIIEGVLGADVVGFQTRQGARNFMELARRYTGARSAPGGLELDERRIRVDAHPISIDARQFDGVARLPDVMERAAEYRRRLDGRKALLGVDRMDYTKGIDLRLRAYEELLRKGEISADQVVLVQSGVPTRERVEEYADLRSRIEGLVGQINGEFSKVGQVAVQYLRQSLPVEELVSLYLASDVMLVTPSRDGMNLVAKEYVASRHDERGVLILSEFTGAAHELKHALIVNPHDIDGMAAAMKRAIQMDDNEQARRMRALRKTVFEHDVYAWADGFLQQLRHEAAPV